MKRYRVTDENGVGHVIEGSDMRAVLVVYEQILAPRLGSGEPIRVELADD